ncbi:EscI/YscI/HrpB family type III secretion system inner rod protein [Noviherbaspirillum saxi]|nr:EscI/YscI/HrpB family type III secretion system inner rod protein [Noviherbaspirillum saxi]
MSERTLSKIQDTGTLMEQVGEANPSGNSAGWSDVADFHAALNHGGQGNAMTPVHAVSAHGDIQSMLSSLQSVSSRLQTRNKAIDKALFKSSESYDPQAMWKVTHEMSEMYLEASLATKVIGKVEQAVEQLTRLQ